MDHSLLLRLKAAAMLRNLCIWRANYSCHHGCWYHGCHNVWQHIWIVFAMLRNLGGEHYGQHFRHSWQYIYKDYSLLLSLKAAAMLRNLCIWRGLALHSPSLRPLKRPNLGNQKHHGSKSGIWCGLQKIKTCLFQIRRTMIAKVMTKAEDDMDYNKLASSKLRFRVRNYAHWLTYLLTGVKCRATSVAKN